LLTRRTHRVLLGLVALMATIMVVLPANSGAWPTRTKASNARCPWIAQSLRPGASPVKLANEVLARMTLRQKAGYAVLGSQPPLGNTNLGVARLCLPPLTMSDGPVGLASGLTGVTQWPAEIALAATFNSGLARLYGAALGAETRAKGIDAIQAPELNVTRIALSGRTFETFGEDPYLAGTLGAAEIRGIQSEGTMANLKHFGAYTQETARLHLAQRVGLRALNEVYLAPFHQALTAHPASVMCAYGSINGVNTCADAGLFRRLRQWGFRGFIRSDFHAVLNVPASYQAGIDLVKPTSVSGLVKLVRRGVLPLRSLNRAVRDVLTMMFRFNLVTNPRHFSPNSPASTPAHVALALRIAESSIVLLKNSDHLLPLTRGAHSLAVIGLDASTNPLVAGGGSSAVLAPYVSTPLRSITSAFPSAKVSYARGSLNARDLDNLSDVNFLRGRPFLNGQPVPVKTEPGKVDLAVLTSPNITPQVATATRPGSGPGWNHEFLHLQTMRGGLYQMAVQQYGDTWVSLNGVNILASRGLHDRNVISTTITLLAHRRYGLSVRWFNIRDHQPPKFGVLDVSPRIARAVKAARRARVAIVFASDYSAEGADRPNLSLPGDQNALIAAVAKANPRTIVVLNTSGAVAMPWLSHVAGVLEAWYPGQVSGQALAAVLSGAFNPTGRLPMTFPTSMSAMPASSPASYPGVNEVVNFGNSLNVGYRWYQAAKVRPLFPFGFGLSYTHFTMNQLRARVRGPNVVLHVAITNVGPRVGTSVVQVYVHFPTSLGEPREQLRGVATVTLAPGATRDVGVRIPISSLATFPHGAWTIAAGTYRFDVGTSANNLTLHATTTLT